MKPWRISCLTWNLVEISLRKAWKSEQITCCQSFLKYFVWRIFAIFNLLVFIVFDEVDVGIFLQNFFYWKLRFGFLCEWSHFWYLCSRGNIYKSLIFLWNFIQNQDIKTDFTRTYDYIYPFIHPDGVYRASFYLIQIFRFSALLVSKL